MKKTYLFLQKTFIAGLVFLLPFLLLFVLLSKVVQFLTGFTSRIAGAFGMKSVVGISGGTIISAISMILVCILCGYLVRVAFFKSMRNWVDKKMIANIPGYATYREMALSKIEKKDEVLPYQSAVWLNIENREQPAFLMEKMPDGKLVIFVPTAGNVKEGTVYKLSADKVQICPSVTDMKLFRAAVNNLGAGFSKIPGA